VYIGDFIYGRDGKVASRRDLDGLRKWRDTEMPKLEGEILTADVVPAMEPNMFLCMP
jgi:hypothetical protein